MLFKNRPRKRTTTAPPTSAERWTVAEWSVERGRGRVRSTSGRLADFDANVSLVADLRIGEPVQITFDAAGARVVRLEPDHLPPATSLHPGPLVQVEETPLLDLRLDEPEVRMDLEDRLFERHDIAMIDRRDGFVLLSSPDERPDQGARVRAFLEETFQRRLETLVRISADYPFDWQRGDGERLMSIFRQLPGYRGEETPTFFGDQLGVAPWLDASFEPPGLLVSGVLRRAEWEAWSTAFERRAAGAFRYRRM